ncbi:hypothetical protein niasHT_006849 [Heterodera trifolii]|uniref:Uncharacterized protein n=1 Tax=Heterodera trifolii TaxID=157864 RepID=A0ABD2JYS0_9BILA
MTGLIRDRSRYFSSLPPRVESPFSGVEPLSSVTRHHHGSQIHYHRKLIRQTLERHVAGTRPCDQLSCSESTLDARRALGFVANKCAPLWGDWSFAQACAWAAKATEQVVMTQRWPGIRASRTWEEPSRRWTQLRGQCTGTHTSTPDFPVRTLPQAKGRRALMSRVFSNASTLVPRQGVPIHELIGLVNHGNTPLARIPTPPPTLGSASPVLSSSTAFTSCMFYHFDSCQSLEKLRPRQRWHPSSSHHRSMPSTSASKHLNPDGCAAHSEIGSLFQPQYRKNGIPPHFTHGNQPTQNTYD